MLARLFGLIRAVLERPFSYPQMFENSGRTIQPLHKTWGDLDASTADSPWPISSIAHGCRPLSEVARSHSGRRHGGISRSRDVREGMIHLFTLGTTISSQVPWIF